MPLRLTFILIGFFNFVGAHDQQVSEIPVPTVIQNDAAVAALFPNLIGFRTVQLCHERHLGLTDDQLRILTAAVDRYVESSGISREAEDAVRSFSKAVVEKESEKWGPQELKSKCDEAGKIFSVPAGAPDA